MKLAWTMMIAGILLLLDGIANVILLNPYPLLLDFGLGAYLLVKGRKRLKAHKALDRQR